MEILSGFMLLVSIVGAFLTLIWFIMPFVILAIKGKVDRAVDQLAALDERLARLEAQLARRPAAAPGDGP